MRPLFAAVAAAIVLIGPSACGSDGDPAATNTVKEITVSIVDGSVDPAPTRIDVARGQIVRVTVTSDVVDLVHVHGYDTG